MSILDTVYSDWSPVKGKQVMQAVIAKYGKQIDAVLSTHGLQTPGSIEAFAEAGYKAGEIPDGKPTVWASPRETTVAGIHVIYQEFNLFPHLPVAENIYLGRERRGAIGLLDRRRTRRDAAEILSRLGVVIDPDALVNEFSVADQQMIEIARGAGARRQTADRR